VGGLQGDFVSFALDRRCWFWGHYSGEKMVEYHGKQCKFCGMGVDWAGRDPFVYTTEQMIEVYAEAMKDKYVRHIGINAGTYPPPGRGHAEHAAVIRALKEKFNVWIRLSIAPPEEEKYVDLLYDAGADLVGYDYEVYDPKLYEYICPGKFEEIDKGKPHQHYDRILRYASKRAGRDHVYSNILAGLEPRESTVEGVRHLASLGVLPRVFVFKALRGSVFEDHSTARVEDLVYIYRHLKHIVEDEFHEDVGCTGCARIEVGTKAYWGIDPRMPAITDRDLELAGIDPAATY